MATRHLHDGSLAAAAPGAALRRPQALARLVFPAEPGAPGLFLIGVGLGIMLTPSVNVVQSAFPENLQGEISGLSRSVSNLGSSIGTAIAGTILVAGLADPSRSYGIAMIVLAFIGLIGLGATILLPAAEPAPGADVPVPAAERRP
jgi:predicted MFS family arabinose efflux permease